MGLKPLAVRLYALAFERATLSEQHIDHRQVPPCTSHNCDSAFWAAHFGAVSKLRLHVCGNIDLLICGGAAARCNLVARAVSNRVCSTSLRRADYGTHTHIHAWLHPFHGCTFRSLVSPLADYPTGRAAHHPWCCLRAQMAPDIWRPRVCTTGGGGGGSAGTSAFASASSNCLLSRRASRSAFFSLSDACSACTCSRRARAGSSTVREGGGWGEGGVVGEAAALGEVWARSTLAARGGWRW